MAEISTEELRTQAELISTINASLRTTNTELQSAAGWAAAMSRSLRDELDELDGDLDRITASMSRYTGSVEGGVASASSSIRDLASEATESVNRSTSNASTALQKATYVVDEVSVQAQNATEFMLGKFDEMYGYLSKDHWMSFRYYLYSIRDQYGGAFGDMSNANQEWSDSMVALGASLYSNFSQPIDGTMLSMRNMYGSIEETREVLEAMTKDVGFTFMFLRDQTEETLVDLNVYRKGLGLSAEELRVFLERQQSRYTDSSNDMLDEAAIYAKRMEAGFGIPAKAIIQNVVGMTEATNTFGNMSQKSMAAASTQLTRLGLDYSHMDSLVSGFTGFEGAASKVADLTAAFGLQIDTMDLVQAANEDPLKAMEMIRQAMQDTGMDVRDLGMQEKRFIADRLNLADIGVVEKLFSPDAATESMEDLLAAAETAAAGVDETSAAALLEADIARVTDSVDNMGASLSEAFGGEAAQAAYEVFTHNAAVASQNLIEFGQDAVSVGAQVTQQGLEPINRLAGVAIERFEPFLEIFKNLQPVLEELTVVLTTFTEAVATGIEENLLPSEEGIQELVTSWNEGVGKMIDGAIQKLGASNFVGEVIETFSGVTAPFFEIGQGWAESIFLGMKTQGADQVDEVIDSLIEGVNGALELDSPSKVGMRQGADWAEGIALGLDTGISKLGDAMSIPEIPIIEPLAAAAIDISEQGANWVEDIALALDTGISKLGDAMSIPEIPMIEPLAATAIDISEKVSKFNEQLVSRVIEARQNQPPIHLNISLNLDQQGITALSRALVQPNDDGFSLASVTT